MKNDIENLTDVKFFVDTFYGYVQKDELLGPIFHARIGENWDPHLEKMYRFWQTVLFHVQAYSGSPFLPHAKLSLERKHFERWLTLFKKTIQENFEGENANNALQKATNISEMFQHKIAYYNGKTPQK